MTPAPLRLREVAWVGGGQTAGAAGVLLLGVALAHRLGPEEFGRYTLALTIGVLAQQVVFGGVQGAAIRLAASADETGEGAAFRAGLRSLALAATGAYAACAALAAIVIGAGVGFDGATLVLLAAAGALAGAGSQLLTSLDAARRQRARVALQNAALPWARLVGALGACALVAATGAVALAGIAVATAVVLGIQRATRRRHDRPAGDPAGDGAVWRARLWAYAWPFSLFGIFSWLQGSVDRWALGGMCSLAETGAYAAIHLIGFMPMVLSGAMVEAVLVPVLFAQAGDGADRGRLAAAGARAAAAAGWFALATIAAAAAATTVGPALCGWLLPPEYSSVSDRLWLMVLAGGLTACGQLLALVRLQRLETRALLAPKIAAAAVAIAGSIAGAAIAGSLGVAVAQAAAAALYAAWMLVSLRRGSAWAS